jgi:RNA polymerase sigma-70 factor (ECF subfamily)
MLGREQRPKTSLQELSSASGRGAGSYRPEVGGREIQPMTWLIAIVRNRALDALRTRAAPQRKWNGTMPKRRRGVGHAAAAPSALELLSQAAQALKVEGCLGRAGGIAPPEPRARLLTRA